MDSDPGDQPVPSAGSDQERDGSNASTPQADWDTRPGHPEHGRLIGPRLSWTECRAAHRRFVADQVEAEYVEYTEAMARIGHARRWRRARRRFLQARGLDISGALDNELRSFLADD